MRRYAAWALAIGLSATAPISVGASADHATAFDVHEKSIDELQQALIDHRVTSRELVQAYLARILAYDHSGPALNAIATINPFALAQADALDRERIEKGPRGPLHGIPVLIKDNFGTLDMPTTAGTLALATYQTNMDASQVRRLREAGAIILGKTTMHELAMNILNLSSLTGQTRNPYDPRRSPGGSSGGTGASIGASFAAAGMGTDTCGSIRVPAAWQNLYGLRATSGLSSRAGIIPLSSTADMAGPMTRSVADLAIMLDATVGYDPADPVTVAMKHQPTPQYRAHLRLGALKTVRIGVLREYITSPQMNGVMRDKILESFERMQKHGATLIDVEIPGIDSALKAAANITAHEFRFDFEAFLRAHPGAPIASLSELVKDGLVHAAIDERLKRRAVSETRDEQAYADTLKKRGEARLKIIEAMNRAKVDVLIYPTTTQPPVIWGAETSGVPTCGLSSATGLPALALPLGFSSEKLPVGLDILARPFEETRLLNFAYDWEALAKPREVPFSTPPLTHEGPPKLSHFNIHVSDGTKASTTAEVTFTLNPLTAILSYKARIKRLGSDMPVALTLQQSAAGKPGPVIDLLLREGQISGSSDLHLTPRAQADLLTGQLMVVLYTRQWPLGIARMQLKVSHYR